MVGERLTIDFHYSQFPSVQKRKSGSRFLPAVRCTEPSFAVGEEHHANAIEFARDPNLGLGSKP
jgi:hypothetical protein